jgi:hypothetical protein
LRKHVSSSLRIPPHIRCFGSAYAPLPAHSRALSLLLLHPCRAFRVRIGRLLLTVLALSEHGARSSLYDEAKAIVKKHKATPEEVEVQLDQYRQDGIPDDKRFNGKKGLFSNLVLHAIVCFVESHHVYFIFHSSFLHF